jgi:hypothetical protein
LNLNINLKSKDTTPSIPLLLRSLMLAKEGGGSYKIYLKAFYQIKKGKAYNNLSLFYK